MKYFLYKVCKNCHITRNLTSRVESMLLIVYANDMEKVKKLTQIEMLKIILITIAVFLLLLIPGEINICNVFMATVIIYLIIENRIYSKYDRLEIKLLKQFEKFIQDVRFKFKYNEMVDDAIEDAFQNAENEMAIQGALMLDSLNRCDEKDNHGGYAECAPNHFFKTFYALCETVMRYGDKVVDGQSVFIRNIGYLKDDIGIEILKRDKVNAMFMGLNAIVIFPLLGIVPIELWAIGNVAELKSFYYGIIGRITIILITIISALIFKVIMKLRYPIEYDNHKSSWINELLSVTVIDNLVMWMIRKNYKYYYKQEEMLKSIVYRYNVKEFLVYRIVCALTCFFISNVLMIGIGFHNAFGSKGIYCNLLISFAISIIGYNYEYFMVAIRKQLLIINREEEVVRFQSIILILMNMDRITIEGILEWLENFAVVFKNDIEKISDSLPYKGMKTFEEAKDKIQFLPMERIYDGFIASDRIGIRNAFSDVLSDRLYYIDKHKQENEIIINNKTLIAKFISFMPLCMIIILVLVVPFVTEGLNQLSSYGGI